jgi:hypothetical protein
VARARCSFLVSFGLMRADHLLLGGVVVRRRPGAVLASLCLVLVGVDGVYRVPELTALVLVDQGADDLICGLERSAREGDAGEPSPRVPADGDRRYFTHDNRHATSHVPAVGRRLRVSLARTLAGRVSSNVNYGRILAILALGEDWTRTANAPPCVNCLTFSWRRKMHRRPSCRSIGTSLGRRPCAGERNLALSKKPIRPPRGGKGGCGKSRILKGKKRFGGASRSKTRLKKRYRRGGKR